MGFAGAHDKASSPNLHEEALCAIAAFPSHMNKEKSRRNPQQNNGEAHDRGRMD